MLQTELYTDTFIAWEHWPDTCEYITSAEIEIGGLVLLHQRIEEHVSIVYTCNTYFVMLWSMWFYSVVSGQYLYTITTLMFVLYNLASNGLRDSWI